MTSVRGCCLALACLCLLAGRSAACCCERIDPKVLASSSPLIVTGTIVRVEPGAAAWGADLAHVRVEAVHRTVFTDVRAEPGCDLPFVVQDHLRDASDRVLRHPVGTRAIWIVFVGEDGSLSIHHHVDRLSELGAIPAENARYSKAEWVARQEREHRWRFLSHIVKRNANEVFATVGLWNTRKQAPTYGWALVLAAVALFVALASLPRQRRSRAQLRFPASVKRL
jgi:hypothetical protein